VTRPIILANSRLHVGIGPNADIEDVYYPYVGYSDHVHRISLGAWVDGRIGWLRDGWEVTQRYLKGAPVGITEASSSSLGLKITSTDFVHPASDVLWRGVKLENRAQSQRDIRLFTYQDLHIDESPLGDTAMLDPHLRAIVHYKNDFYFAFCSSPVFDQFATGRKEWQGLEGTWKDAEDGVLSGNAVSNGPVDSCIAWNFDSVQPEESKNVQLFMVVGRHFRNIRKLHANAMNQGFEQALVETQKFWQNWVSHGQDKRSSILPDRVHEVYNRSLLVLRSMCSENGAMIASSDSEIERIGGDTYDYVWPRDASWCAIALDQCGYHSITQKFFSFIFDVITDKGYLLHKYYPTGLFGSTWHPVPFIQIDQSGIVLHALWNFYETTGDVEFVAQHWPHVLKIATFLASWRDKSNNLPHPSWDLWEEREATTTYSAAAVHAGLRAGSNLARLVGLENNALQLYQAANDVKDGIFKYLYDPKLGRFLRSVNPRDETVDASLLAVSNFGVVPVQDARVAGTVKAIEEQLWVKTGIGGVARYSGDGYLKVSPGIIGNPWILTTLYLSMCHADAGNLARARELIEWATARASTSGLLSEQVNPYDGSPVGVLPLAWSHAAYILAVGKLAAQLSAKKLAWDSKI
jgi:oligosaccharide amylase